MALIPLALVVGAWTASLGSGTSAAANLGGIRPGIPAVPTAEFGFPASFTTAAAHKASSPIAHRGHRGLSVASVGANGIPSTALVAYQRAEAVLRKADPSCHLSWALVAAIGEVESDHGRFGGNVLLSDGTSTPGIYGPQLDGSHGTMVVKDTDSGAFDHDQAYDRAVGAMQFIPTTWRVVGVDGDGDGARNPQDIDDSSLATAVYLCAGSQDLSSASGQRAAVFGYNHSSAYVALVLSTMHAYLNGQYTQVADGIPVGVAPPATAPSRVASAHRSRPSAAKQSPLLIADGPQSTAADPRPDAPAGGDPTNGGAASATPTSAAPETVTRPASTTAMLTTTPTVTPPASTMATSTLTTTPTVTSTAPASLVPPTTTTSTFGGATTPTAPTTISPTLTPTTPTTSSTVTSTAPTTTSPTTTAVTTTTPSAVSTTMTPPSPTATSTDPTSWVVRPTLTKTGEVVSAREACVAAVADAQRSECTAAYQSGSQHEVDAFFAALPAWQGYRPLAELTAIRVRH